MSKYEKLGAFLLFEKIEEDKLSKNFLAGQIIDNQIQQINVIKKFDHSLSTAPDFILDLNQEYEVLKTLANPNIVRPNIFVQEKSEFAAVFDYVEGKSLRAVLSKCGPDGFPFTVDHSLLIASRLCTAIEYLHSKKVNDQRLIHGFVCPETILVTYDGEIKLQYLGLAHALMKFPAGRDKFFHDYKNYLAPEVFNQQKLGKAADVYGAGVVLYEMLAGEALLAKGRNVNVAEAIEQAQMTSTSGEKTPLPDDLKNILKQSLAADPAQRYESISDMRKALDLMLFSSEFSPTTFNLAFFMHSLFRENIDEENKNVTTFKKVDVSSYLKEEPPPAKAEHPVGATAAKDVPMPLSMDRAPQQVFPAPEMFSTGVEEKSKSKMPLIIGALIVIAVIATVGILFFPKKEEPSKTASTVQQNQPTPQQKEVQDAEKQRLIEEASKAQEEAKRKDQELADLKAKLDALVKAQQQGQQQQKPGTTAPAAAVPDAAAIQKLQEQARKLEEEKKKQETLAQEKLKAAQTPAPAAAAADTTPANNTQIASSNPPVNAAPDTTAQQSAAQTPDSTAVEMPANPTAPDEVKQEIHEGDEVQLSGDMIRPEITNRVQPEYPPVARAKKIEGTVILNVFISETGGVIDVKVLRPAGGSSGLNEAATSAVKRWKFRPAVKEGKRVKVWMAIPVVFKLQG